MSAVIKPSISLSVISYKQSRSIPPYNILQYILSLCYQSLFMSRIIDQKSYICIVWYIFLYFYMSQSVCHCHSIHLSLLILSYLYSVNLQIPLWLLFRISISALSFSKLYQYLIKLKQNTKF